MACPNSVRAEGPIDVRLEEVAKAAFFDMFRQPIDLLVVGQHWSLNCVVRMNQLLAELNQRVLVRPPAERVLVQILFLVEQQAALPQFATDVLIGLFNPASLIIGLSAVNLPSGPTALTNVGPSPGRKRFCSATRTSKSTSPNAALMHDAGAGISRNKLGGDHFARR